MRGDDFAAQLIEASDAAAGMAPDAELIPSPAELNYRIKCLRTDFENFTREVRTWQMTQPNKSPPSPLLPLLRLASVLALLLVLSSPLMRRP